MKFILLLFTTLTLANSAFARDYCANAEERKCLADTINSEARNQGIEGMLVVAATVMTRYHRGYTGRSICGITRTSYTRVASRPTKGGPIDIEANRNIERATEAGCKMGDMGMTHFYREGSKRPSWANEFPPANIGNNGKVGKHYIYNAPAETRANYSTTTDRDRRRPKDPFNRYHELSSSSEEDAGVL